MTNKTICRVEKTKNFTTINNKALRDVNLSWKAKGLFAYMMTNKDDWTFYIDELKNHAKDGKMATKNAFNELGLNGYLSVKIKYDHINKEFAGREIVLYETPTEKRAEMFVEYRDKFKHKDKTNEAVSSDIENPVDIININLKRSPLSA